MSAILFHAVVGPDQVIRPPAGVSLPEGEIEVSVRRSATSCDDPLPPRPGPGLFKGSILYMAPDFDAPLEDMREYME